MEPGLLAERTMKLTVGLFIVQILNPLILFQHLSIRACAILALDALGARKRSIRRSFRFDL